jgi:hypothetical protein
MLAIRRAKQYVLGSERERGAAADAIEQSSDMLKKKSDVQDVDVK